MSLSSFHGGRAFVPDSAADTFTLNCSASVSAKLFLMADSVALIRPTTGNHCCAIGSPLAKTSFPLVGQVVHQLVLNVLKDKARICLSFLTIDLLG